MSSVVLSQTENPISVIQNETCYTLLDAFQNNIYKKGSEINISNKHADFHNLFAFMILLLDLKMPITDMYFIYLVTKRNVHGIY